MVCRSWSPNGKVDKIKSITPLLKAEFLELSHTIKPFICRLPVPRSVLSPLLGLTEVFGRCISVILIDRVGRRFLLIASGLVRYLYMI